VDRATNVLLALDVIGVLAFALTGLVEGVRKGADLFGIGFLAFITAFGVNGQRSAFGQTTFLLGGKRILALASNRHCNLGSLHLEVTVRPTHGENR
jgi:hypothetical protein